MKVRPRDLFCKVTGQCSPADATLAACGVCIAGAAAIFAGSMLSEKDHAPRIYGMEYLAIFARPSGSERSVEVARARLPSPSGSSGSMREVLVDPAPTGSIRRPAAAAPVYRIESARPGMAVLRRGAATIVVAPGIEVPELGRVGAVDYRSGSWVVLDTNGAVLLSMQEALTPNRRTADPFARKMIFDQAPPSR